MTHNRVPGKQKSGAVKEIPVTERSGLLEYLLRTLTGQSRNNIKSLLTHRQVLVDGRIVTQHDFPLREGQTIRIVRSVDRTKKTRTDQAIKILFEDDDIIVIDKPAGLLTIADANENEKTAYHMVTDYVKGNHPRNRVFIVHRLDRDTSGVILFAKNERTKLALQDHWNELVTLRSYLAVVEGQPKEKSGRIRSWLRETKTMLMYSGSKPGDGLEAITNYQVLKETDDYSLLAVQLETGRKNQIRVHMKELGHPVAGDKKYGAKTNPIKRLALHANKLELIDPFSKKPLCFEADLPKSFAALFRDR